MFFINDLTISYPHAEHERVSVRTSTLPSTPGFSLMDRF